MTGLHSRGYRPKPGERLQRGGSGLTQRELWSLVWHHLRGGVGVSSLRFGRLAVECLDAREAPDPLDAGQVDRWASRGWARARAEGLL